MPFFKIVGKDCPVDFSRVLDNVCTKCPYRDEEALDAPSVLQASQEILKSDDFDSCSKEFKDELRQVRKPKNYRMEAGR